MSFIPLTEQQVRAEKLQTMHVSNSVVREKVAAPISGMISEGSGGTTVRLENPPGTLLATRQFDPGQPLHIAVTCRGSFGIGSPDVNVVLSISDTTFPPIYGNKFTNLLGNTDFDVTLPNLVTKATLKVIATWPVAGQDIVIIPIGIGTSPAPLPNPSPPSNIFTTIEKIVQYGAIGAGVIGIVYLASKAAPTVAQGYKSFKK